MSDKPDFWSGLGCAVIILVLGVAAVLWSYAAELAAETEVLKQKIETTKPGE